MECILNCSTRYLKIEWVRSVSSVWNHNYEFRPKFHSTQLNYHFMTPFHSQSKCQAKFWKKKKLQISPLGGFPWLSFSCNFIGYLKADWLFSFSVPLSLARGKVQFRVQNSASWEQIALLRANQIARTSSDFQKDVINYTNTYYTNTYYTRTQLQLISDLKYTWKLS